MKILRLIYEWPPPWTGLVPHPFEITRSQAALGHKISVFCGRWPRQGDQEELDNVELITFLGNSKLPFRALFPGTMLVTAAPLLLFRYIWWRRKNTVDIIHSHGHFGLWVYLYRFILGKVFPRARELQTPLVVHFHINVEGRKRKVLEKGGSIKPLTKYLDWPLAKLSDTLAIKTADAYICVSDNLKEEFIKYNGAESGRCFVVESGVNPSRFKPVGGEEKEKTQRDLGLDPHDKLITYHGFLVERKGIHLLIDSLSYLPDHYKLFLSGPFSSADKAYRERITEMISKNKLKHRVIMSGYTPYPQSPIVFQASDLFMLPSAAEGTPKVVMEALSTGVPALVSGFKFSEDIKGLYYLENLAPKYIADQAKKLIEEDPFVDRQKVAKIYSWKERTKKIEKVYEFVQQNRPGISGGLSN